MKRDMDLIRDLLLQIEAAPAGEMIPEGHFQFPDRSDAEVMEHIVLIGEAGLIKAVGGGVRRPGLPSIAGVNGLTWRGHDFIETVRNDTVWAKTKAALTKHGGAATIEIVTALALTYAKARLGLSPEPTAK